ncbi:DNA-processing protein DprA [Dinoroseobacter sp. S124A]|uniref:DNA-processing protein DprA n=1 Tax=Dinoroseobacter sp. S124A TaxID=3415128 RepID=UPI003C7DF006
MAKDIAPDQPVRTDYAAPTSVDEALDWLQLLRSPRIGPVTFHKLLSEHGTARAAMEALPQVTASAGLKDYQLIPRDRVEREYAAGRKKGARLAAFGGALYSPVLAEIEDAPPLLWCLGDLDFLKRPCLALVGARNASALGQRLARAFAKGVGTEGLLTVSGLARGIDTAVHDASLETGTIAVVAGGVDVIYPQENLKLYKQIAQKGLIVSEQPMGMQPQARHFPRRNRLISGLSRAVVVVEAAIKSGSLLTARDAADQGREVMAAPGHPFDGRAAGCNQLLREGATLVRNAEDILLALPPSLPQGLLPLEPPETAPPMPQKTPPMDELRGRILAHLGAAPLPEDQVIRALGLPAAPVNAALVELEMSGTITRAPGGFLSLRG